MKLQVLEDRKTIQFINPPENGFGFLYFSHMIPPFRPERCSILGYGNGTVGKLIYKIWGDVAIFGVDVEAQEKLDARDYLRYLIKKNFTDDYIAIDLWNDDKVCEFIYGNQFISNLRTVASKMICLNIPIDDLEKAAKVYTDAGFQYLRHDQVEANAVIFFGVPNA